MSGRLIARCSLILDLSLLLSVVCFRIHLCWPTLCLLSRRDLFLLNVAHHVHDALVNADQIASGQGPPVGVLHIVKDNAFAVRLIHGHIGITLQPSNLHGGACALAQQRDEPAIEFIDFVSPVLDVHRSNQLSAISKYPSSAQFSATSSNRKSNSYAEVAED